MTGISPRVADCIALFTLNKMKAFPVDTRVGKQCENFTSGIYSNNPTSQLQYGPRTRFGKYAGYANQFCTWDLLRGYWKESVTLSRSKGEAPAMNRKLSGFAWLPSTHPHMPRQLPLNPHTNHSFHLQKSLEGRQDFRWRKLPNAYHSVVLNGTLIHIRQAEDRLTYRSTPDADLTGLLRSYFRLDDDLDAIYTEIAARDDHIAKLIQKYPASASCGNPTPGNASSPTSAPREPPHQESPTASRRLQPNWAAR